MVAVKTAALGLLASMVTCSWATPIDGGAGATALDTRDTANSNSASVYTYSGFGCATIAESQNFQGDNVHICHDVTNIGSVRVEGR